MGREDAFSTIHIIIQFIYVLNVRLNTFAGPRPFAQYSLLVRVCNLDYYKQGMKEFTTTNLKYSLFFTNSVSTMKLFHTYIIQNHLHSSNASQQMHGYRIYRLQLSRQVCCINKRRGIIML